MRRERARSRPTAWLVCALVACGSLGAYAARPEGDIVDKPGPVDASSSAFSFAVVASRTTIDGAPETASLLRAIGDGDARFVVQFDAAVASSGASSCSDEALERRRTTLDAGPKPSIPIPATSEWADCGSGGGDPFERLERVGETLFAADQSLGQQRLPWFRQSATPRFHRYRENLRWQVGRVLFATVNLPDNNNNFHIGAGRNGEFEERLVANRAWLQRTFRLASERKAIGVVLFIDAAPHFATPWRVPDLRSSERDGYYEWKVTLRDVVAAFDGKVLLVQGGHARAAAGAAPVGQARSDALAERPYDIDHPLHDANGRPLSNLTRVDVLRSGSDARWLHVSVDPRSPAVFRIAPQRAFDDPTGELYGAPRVR